MTILSENYRQPFFAIFSFLYFFFFTILFLLLLGKETMRQEFWYYLPVLLVLAVQSLALFLQWQNKIFQIESLLPFILFSSFAQIVKSILLLSAAVGHNEAVPLWLSPLWLKKTGLAWLLLWQTLEIIVLVSPLWLARKRWKQELSASLSDSLSFFHRKGFYRYFRHPEKAFLLFSLPGITLYFNIYWVLLFGILMVFFLIYWIQKQEKIFETQIDSDFLAHDSRRARLLPFYW